MSEPYRSKIANEETDSLFDAILKLESVEECYRFFDDLCTIPELKSIAQRWMVARMLDTGATYSDISRDLSASTATISRVNRSLSYGAGGYRLLLERTEPLPEKKD